MPSCWEAKAYPSLKPLAAWVTDLQERLAFLSGWISGGPPPVMWLSGIFFPQAMLTAVLQNHARRHHLPIDSLTFEFEYLTDKGEAWSGITAGPADGVYVRGLFLEGARFDNAGRCLADSLPKQLYTPLPVIHLKPVQAKVSAATGSGAPPAGVYRCPVYRTLSRYGVLATTGHSSNYVCTIDLPSGPSGQPILNNVGEADDAKWIKAGVAAFLALKY